MPKVRIPQRNPIDLPENKVNSNLPPVFMQPFFTANFGSHLPEIATLSAWGRGRILYTAFPIIGGQWIPLTWTLDLVPGQDFVLHIHMTWFRRIILQGGDELRQGHGRFSVGPSILENENLDLSEKTMMWIYSLWLAPFSLIMDNQAEWQAADNHSFQAEIRFDDTHTRTFKLEIDPTNEHLERILSTRTTSKDGQELRFQAVFNNHRIFENNFTYPSHIALYWEEEAAYLHLDLIGLRFNVDVEESIQKGLD